MFFLIFLVVYKLKKCISFTYNSSQRKVVKKYIANNFNIMTEDHHIIPKQFENHPFIKSVKFKIDNKDNLILMPNKYTNLSINYSVHNLFPDIYLSKILNHRGGHKSYNHYVKSVLDNFIIGSEESHYNFHLFFMFLRCNCYENRDNIPWK